MQEDKEPLFDSAATVNDSLLVMAGMIASARFDAHRFEEELSNDSLLATELADYLVRKEVPFRDAHGIIGEIVRQSVEQRTPLARLPIGFYQSFTEKFGPDLYRYLDPRKSLQRKLSEGSTSPRLVRAALRRWQKRVKG